MTLYHVLALFLNGSARGTLRLWARQFRGTSYRSLTAFFHRDWRPQAVLEAAWRQLLPLDQGWLILDEIVLAKSKVGRGRAVKRKWKHGGGYTTPAVSIVLLLWTDGVRRVPLRFELWRPGAGSAVDAALRLLSWARNRLRIRPQCVLFDAGFGAARLLRRVDAYGWAFVCRVPKTRQLDGVAMWRYKRQGYWHAVGDAWCGLRLLVIRRAGKFYVTNRRTWTADETLTWYGRRHPIEETFKILKGVCHWDRCQFSNDDAYERFLAVGAVAFMVWEAKRLQRREPVTIYALRRTAILHRRTSVPSCLQALPHAC